jgi:hypothetical protein
MLSGDSATAVGLTLLGLTIFILAVVQQVSLCRSCIEPRAQNLYFLYYSAKAINDYTLLRQATDFKICFCYIQLLGEKNNQSL